MMSIEDADTFVHGQFLRIQSYARVASKKAQQVENARAAKKGKPPKTIWNSSEVIAEALRDEGACGHVKAPEPPTFHYGDENGCADSLQNWMATPTRSMLGLVSD